MVSAKDAQGKPGCWDSLLGELHCLVIVIAVILAVGIGVYGGVRLGTWVMA
jgi:hypothetical protein